MDSEFDVRLQRLREALEALQELLGVFEEQHWSRWFARCQVGLEANDPNALDEVLRAFGGMGSFNDLVLSRRDARLRPAAEITLRQAGWTEEEQAANDRLRELGAMIWADATALKVALRSE